MPTDLCNIKHFQYFCAHMITERLKKVLCDTVIKNGRLQDLDDLRSKGTKNNRVCHHLTSIARQLVNLTDGRLNTLLCDNYPVMCQI